MEILYLQISERCSLIMKRNCLVKVVTACVIWFLVFTYLVFLLMPRDHEPQALLHIQKNRTTLNYSSLNFLIKNDNQIYFNASINEIIDTNEIFNLRYWNIVKGVGGNNSLNLQRDEYSLFLDSPQNSLWRPRGTPTGLENDRIIPQLVYQMEAQSSPRLIKSKMKTILLWDGFDWWDKAAWKPSSKGFKHLQQSDCLDTPNSISNCFLTEERTYLNKVDAVILTKDWAHKKEIIIPKKVLAFYFMLESPYHSYARLSSSDQLLATYWRGSDLVTPYRKWMYFDSNKKQMIQAKDYHAGKKFPVAIFVSNCETPNNRSGYIRELQKYIQVDIYGRCGNMQCDRSDGDVCGGMLRRDYYFYLAFENSNCRDYITEKLFITAFDNDIVPVVMGADPADYEAAAPLNSFIHIERFKGPQDLAIYLNFLIQNSLEYNKFFEWKGTGKFINSELFCRLCAMVNYADLFPPPKRRVPFIWGNLENPKSEQICLKSNQWYWNKKS